MAAAAAAGADRAVAERRRDAGAGSGETGQPARRTASSGTTSDDENERSRERAMANISAADVKKLRDLTGAGMMDSKNALTEAEGDFDKAIEALRIKAGAKVSKRDATREATNGLVAAAEGAMIQLVLRDRLRREERAVPAAGDGHRGARRRGPAGRRRRRCWTRRSPTARPSGRTSSRSPASSARSSSSASWPSSTAPVATYLHRRNPDLPPQVGVLVEFTGDDLTAARGAAMQVAAMRPQYVTRDEVPADVVEQRAPDRRGDRPRGGQAGGGAAADRRGPAERLLQGRRADRAVVGAGQQEDRAVSCCRTRALP